MTTQLPGSGAILGGDFRIERQLGAGGMGAVYVAEQLSTGRRRALKLMHPSLVSDAKLRERFEQEARVGARIPSDHVVQVIAAGVDEATGAPFIAMELLEGEDLASTIARRGALAPDDVRAILQPVCHALGAAHAAGIVHRDLKPENIFLLHTQGVQRSFDVKLLDFGIAKLTADARTMATSAVGTPLWMAPEQTDPRAKIAPTADVWPLGLLVFTMLTGRSYWRVAADPAVSIPALMREILFESLDAPSVRAVELGIDVPLPIGFDAWFVQCVERETARRFPTAKEAWEALLPVLGAEVRPPERLAALVKGAADADRARLEAAATAPAVEMAATLPAPGLSGMEATTDASQLAVAASGPAAELSTRQTGSPAERPPRSPLRFLGAVAALALVGIVSWQLATRRAEKQFAAMEENAMPSGLSGQMSAQPETSDRPPLVEPVLPPMPPLPPLPAQSAAAVVSSAAAFASSAAAFASSITAEALARVPKVPAPKLRPFDPMLAQQAADFMARTAGANCRMQAGPRAFSVSLTFAPDGHVSRALIPGVPVMMGTHMCAQNMMRGTTIPAFDPASGTGSVATAIAMD